MTAKEAGVHITADGFEYDRVIIPMLSKYPVERLLILHSRSSPYVRVGELVEQFYRKLEDNPMDVETILVDIYDFDDVFVTTLQQIKKYALRGKRIYINISPVPKLATVAMMSAAFLSEYKENIEIFYASPEEYLIPNLVHELSGLEEGGGELSRLVELRDIFMKKGIATGVKEYHDIPIFPIQDITGVDIEILKVLHERQGVDSIEELVEHVNLQRKETIKRSSIQYRLERLEEYRLVDTEREERRLKIRSNKLGVVYLKGSLI